MKYALVATTRYLLRVNLLTKEVVPLEQHRSEYYGISWFAEDADLVLSHSGLNNHDLISLSAYAQSEVGWISADKKKSNSCLSQPHQIQCAPDGRVVCTNTGRNSIAVLDLNKPHVYQEVRLGSSRWDRLDADDRGADHLNSVFIKNDKLFVLAHRFNKGSQLAVFSYPELELLEVKACGVRTGLHNIWVTDEGQQISCHSELGSLVDLMTDTTIWESGCAIYTRGLAASSNYVLVGESQKVGRDLRSSSLSGLWIIDRHSWKTIDYLCLGPYGAVNEVRLLDVPDDAHHGHPFKGMPWILGRDMSIDITKHRLLTSDVAWNNRMIWQDYSKILGSPDICPNGMQRANEKILCLILKKQPPNPSVLKFSYELNGDIGQSHVSGIIDYHGAGGDTDMTAILLQKRDHDASLGIWQHNSLTWSVLAVDFIDGLPLEGNFIMKVVNNEIIIFINQNEITRLDCQYLNLKDFRSGWGIRWLGASVRPENLN